MAGHTVRMRDRPAQCGTLGNYARLPTTPTKSTKSCLFVYLFFLQMNEDAIMSILQTATNDFNSNNEMKNVLKLVNETTSINFSR